MTDEERDDLINEATHAVAEALGEALSCLSQDARTSFLYRVNDALTPLIQDVVLVTEEA